MKTTIRADGTLVVSPENDLEAYALGQWSNANLPDWFRADRLPMKFMVDLSAYPQALEPIKIRADFPGAR